MSHRSPSRLFVASLLASASLMAACSIGYKPPPPAPLQANPAATPAAINWRSTLSGTVPASLQINTQGNQILVADTQGHIQAFGTNGSALWSYRLEQPLAAGIGSDGNTAAAVTEKQELIAIRQGQPAWRVPLPGPVYTAPLVAGGRIFVLGADQNISAYDAANGFLLWRQKGQAPTGKLALRQPSVLMPAKGALLAGIAGQMNVFNPDNGDVLTSIVMASPRGSTELAYVVDVLAPASRVGDSLCARTYQANVGCINLGNGAQEWAQPNTGTNGITGDSQMVVGADNQGVVTAWSRQNGEVLWKNETLKNRMLTAPLIVNNSVIIGDLQGYVHVLARNNGELRNRLRIDDSAIQAAPVLANNNTAIIATSKGSIASLHVQ